MDRLDELHVVCWSYHDGSSHGCVQIYADEKEALKMLDILAKHGDGMKQYSVATVPCEGVALPVNW